MNYGWNIAEIFTGCFLFLTMETLSYCSMIFKRKHKEQL
jgi:hypothetical protein